MFDVTEPSGDGFSFTISGNETFTRTYGPHASMKEAIRVRFELAKAYKRRAEALGGWSIRHEAGLWRVILPEGVPCPGRAPNVDVVTRGSE